MRPGRQLASSLGLALITIGLLASTALAGQIESPTTQGHHLGTSTGEIPAPASVLIAAPVVLPAPAPLATGALSTPAGTTMPAHSTFAPGADCRYFASRDYLAARTTALIDQL